MYLYVPMYVSCTLFTYKVVGYSIRAKKNVFVLSILDYKITIENILVSDIYNKICRAKVNHKKSALPMSPQNVWFENVMSN